MKIALINLPNPALGEPWSNFPLGLGYVASSIEQRGYDVSVLDYCNGFEEIIPQADIYGMQITAPQVRDAFRLARRIKREYPYSIIVGGGPQMLVDSKRFIESNEFDSVVIGDGEFSFYELVRQKELYGSIEYKYWNRPVSLLDDIPFPARHLFSNFKKNALKTHQLLKGDYVDGGQTTIIGSRGCSWACSFCAPHSRRLIYRSPSNAIAEIKDIIERFGIYQFKWQDDTFTANKKWVFDFCNLLVKKLPRTYHRAHTRVNTFDIEMADVLKKAGFKILCFGIESFSDKLLKINNKKISIDQIENSLKIAKQKGFKTVGFLIFGLPGEDRRTVEETKSGILRNKHLLDYLNLATMVPLPGTPIYEDPKAFGIEILNLDMSKYWIVNHEKSDNIFIKTDHVPFEEMKELKVEMYQFMRDEGFSRPEWEK